ncbi:hypothetical protein BG011_008660 [Mortierella polycephala]|uniref:Uncharacterized protein n=1 Tax=Mortierella polycephala TaxID=41804 RepID=A0A9P6PQQ1_9FUNG|nr:hypothetical protein BG011_008660 [Mortierella polycephala]
MGHDTVGFRWTFPVQVGLTGVSLLFFIISAIAFHFQLRRICRDPEVYAHQSASFGSLILAIIRGFFAFGLAIGMLYVTSTVLKTHSRSFFELPFSRNSPQGLVMKEGFTDLDPRNLFQCPESNFNDVKAVLCSMDRSVMILALVVAILAILEATVVLYFDTSARASLEAIAGKGKTRVDRSEYSGQQIQHAPLSQQQDQYIDLERYPQVSSSSPSSSSSTTASLSVKQGSGYKCYNYAWCYISHAKDIISIILGCLIFFEVALTIKHGEKNSATNTLPHETIVISPPPVQPLQQPYYQQQQQGYYYPQLQQQQSMPLQQLDQQSHYGMQDQLVPPYQQPYYQIPAQPQQQQYDNTVGRHPPPPQVPGSMITTTPQPGAQPIIPYTSPGTTVAVSPVLPTEGYPMPPLPSHP